MGPGRYAHLPVNLTPSALLGHAKSEAGRRAIRYSLTSLTGVIITQLLLTVFLDLLKWKPVESNFVAVTITSVPAFLLNKYWVWGKRGKAHMRREVIPFWLFTVAGWVLSTVSVIVVVKLTHSHAHPDGSKLAVRGANIAGFGVLWVLKYLFLDKIMFGPDHHTPYDEDIEAEELDGDLAPVSRLRTDSVRVDESQPGRLSADPPASPAPIDR